MSKHPKDRRLKIRLRVFCGIWALYVFFICESLIRNEINVGLVVIGGLSGIIPGLILSRMHRIQWDEQSEKIVSRLDWTGAAILILYLLFLYERTWFFGHWVHSERLATFCLCVSAGTMTGRVLGIRRGFRKIMRALELQSD